MLDFITIPLVVGICVAGVYGLFELFARRKERLAIIEKLGDKLDSASFTGKVQLPSFSSPLHFSFSALKVGCLLTGVGLGLLAGFLLNLAVLSQGQVWQGVPYVNDLTGVCYGAGVLLFGGIGLLIAFLVEMRLAKKKEENQK
ncbi:MAG: hypothetical protein LBL81_02765 [Tannerella sp.]|jgi:hypothetical protein|nr:hypothetical protein [Tannerella sp.]